MPRHSLEALSSRSSGRAVTLLTAVAALLLPAAFLAPKSLAANSSESGYAHQHTLIDAVGKAFIGYWNSGEREFTPEMRQVVDYWFRFHAIKAGISLALLIVLVVLGRRIGRMYVAADKSGRVTRAGLASGGVLTLALAVLALVLVIANVQGAVAPFTSALSLMPVAAPHGQLAGTLAQVREQLRASRETGHRSPPAVDMMVGDFARYHEAVVVMSAVLVLVFIGLSAVLWKRFMSTGPSDRRPGRRARGWFAALATFFSLLVAVLLVANLSNAAHPAAGLAGFFAGGF
ncbi:hypothetical protein ACIQPR_21720 [Streptomyces sp. NPDC091280]|uniref:hypothetical protein n=1 Tax=Streptomyces sp. NPDC091280 TaxID=3365984 RepID=UPI003809E646